MDPISLINPNLVKLEYAVRGPIVIRAAELKAKLEKGETLPFDEVINANIGDCHAVGQEPITFLRQFIAIVVYPKLLESPDFPEDAKARARRILNACAGHSIGSYSVSTGIAIIREDVANYIKQRDGVPVDSPDDIFLSTGASSAIKAVLQLLSTTKPGNDRAGIMVPIPQYPLYSATNAELNAFQINYYLDESAEWGLSEQELERALSSAKGKCIPRAIVIINPGNPTGQVLSLEVIQTVLRFAKNHSLVVLADEVYQHNVYAAGKRFHSFKSVLHGMGAGFADQVMLASFMSTSKGYMGECGFRGGYCELVNFHPEMKKHLYKYLSASLCPSTVGQALLGAVVNPPKPGEPSYETFARERDQVLGDLKLKAKLVSETFNSMPGFTCNELQGAMYAFPRIRLPKRAIEAAKAKNVEPDFLYCLSLLEKTGICIVPGSGFGQVEGTYHFRTTILPKVEKMKIFLEKIRKFHEDFLKEYAD